MTIIAAVGGGPGLQPWAIAADWAVSSDNSDVVVHTASPKVREYSVADDDSYQVFIGFAGSTAAHTVLRGDLDSLPPRFAYDSPDDWADSVADAITTAFMDRGGPLLLEYADGSKGVDVECLMVTPEGCWILYDFSAERAVDFAAIGTGKDFAAGYLTASSGTASNGVLAAEVVEHTCDSVSGCSLGRMGDPLVLSPWHMDVEAA